MRAGSRRLPHHSMPALWARSPLRLELSRVTRRKQSIPHPKTHALRQGPLHWAGSVRPYQCGGVRHGGGAQVKPAAALPRRSVEEQGHAERSVGRNVDLAKNAFDHLQLTALQLVMGQANAIGGCRIQPDDLPLVKIKPHLEQTADQSFRWETCLSAVGAAYMPSNCSSKKNRTPNTVFN